MSGLLVIVLGTQLTVRRYIPWLYWAAVVFVSIVGTLITDNLTDQLDVPLEASTAVFAVALAAAFLLWHASEKTLSIHSIFTPRREVFYWVAILVTSPSALPEATPPLNGLIGVTLFPPSYSAWRFCWS